MQGPRRLTIPNRDKIWSPFDVHTTSWFWDWRRAPWRNGFREFFLINLYHWRACWNALWHVHLYFANQGKRISSWVRRRWLQSKDDIIGYEDYGLERKPRIDFPSVLALLHYPWTKTASFTHHNSGEVSPQWMMLMKLRMVPSDLVVLCLLAHLVTSSHYGAIPIAARGNPNWDHSREVPGWMTRQARGRSFSLFS